MKKVFLILSILLFINITASSQPCLPDGIEFSTQAEIDNFQTDYPNCTEIGGIMIIEGSGITNLNGLSVVTKIGGWVRISVNRVLTSLSGLENLKSIGGFLEISYTDSLTSLTGLEGLTSIDGYLHIYYNNALTSLTGLESLTSIGDIDINYNYALASLTDFASLTSIGGTLTISNTVLTSLTGLENLTFIRGDFFIRNNYLTGLTGLDALTHIGGRLYISDPTLISLTGIENLTFIGGQLYISSNALITSLTGLEGLNSIGADLVIHDNSALISLTGIENLNSIGVDLAISDNSALISLTGIENLNSIGADLVIHDNSALISLTGIENLTSIEGRLEINNNDALSCLEGLDNIDAGSVTDLTIVDNLILSTCQVQSVCNYLASPNGVIEIYGNATGCNSTEEVIEACGPPEICMVNVDSLTGKNVVIWGKKQEGAVASYNIYRESTSGGNYEIIGNVSHNNISAFSDNLSNPLQRAYSYRMTSLGICDIESDMGIVHTTMHLSINAGINSYNLIWTPYVGFDYQTYFIYRRQIPGGFQVLDSVPNTITSYSDLNPPSGILDYVIEIRNSNGCVPQKSMNAYSSVFSNVISTNVGIDEQENLSGFTSVSPNPFSGSTSISYFLILKSHVSIRIYDFFGQLIAEPINEQQSKGRHQIIWNAEGQPSGIYFYRFNAANQDSQGRMVVR